MTSPLSRAVHWLTYVTGQSVRKARHQAVNRVLMFHGVGGDAFPTDTLRAVLTLCRRNFEVAPLGDLIARADGGALALTFDDGLRNNATVAAPLLTELELPATFFVCPELIDDGRWLWNHEARERLRSLSHGQRVAVHAGDIEDTIERMKSMTLSARAAAETQIHEASRNFDPSAAQREAFDMMSWDDLRALDTRLITVGSHSSSHPILPTLDEAELEREIRDSRARLEQELGRTVELFCYPNGSEDDRVRDCVAEHYRAAVTTVPGFVPAGGDPHRISRIGAVPHMAEMAWRLHRP